MTAFDYVVLTIFGLSIVVSVLRGVVREIIALAGWIVSFILAQHYAPAIALLLPDSIPDASIKIMAAFVIIFLAVLLLMALVAIAVTQLIKAAGLGLANRTLGAIFGFARGLLIVMVLVLLGGLTSLPRQPQWHLAMFSAPLEALAVMIRGWLPPELSTRISYD